MFLIYFIKRVKMYFCLHYGLAHFSIAPSYFRLFKSKEFRLWLVFKTGDRPSLLDGKPLRYHQRVGLGVPPPQVPFNPCAGYAVHPFRLCRLGVAGLILNLCVFYTIRTKPMGPPGFRCPLRGSRGKSSGLAPSASTQLEAVKKPCPTKTSSGARR